MHIAHIMLLCSFSRLEFIRFIITSELVGCIIFFKSTFWHKSVRLRVKYDSVIFLFPLWEWPESIWRSSQVLPFIKNLLNLPWCLPQAAVGPGTLCPCQRVAAIASFPLVFLERARWGACCTWGLAWSWLVSWSTVRARKPCCFWTKLGQETHPRGAVPTPSFSHPSAPRTMLTRSEGKPLMCKPQGFQLLRAAAPHCRPAPVGVLCSTPCGGEVADEPVSLVWSLFVMAQGAPRERELAGGAAGWVPEIGAIHHTGALMPHAVIAAIKDHGTISLRVAPSWLVVFFSYPSFFSGFLILRSEIIHGQCTPVSPPVIYCNFCVPCSPLIGLSMQSCSAQHKDGLYGILCWGKSTHRAGSLPRCS